MTDKDQSTVWEATESFLEEHPGSRSDLEAVLEVDTAQDRWEFDDVPLDSGRFGEMVSRGLVERDDAGYHISHPAGVQAALRGEEVRTTENRTPIRRTLRETVSLNYGNTGALVVALVVVILARMTQYPHIFQQNRVVSPGNDPYFFRYWQEQLLTEAAGPFSFGVVVNPPWNDGGWNQRPLTHATNWWLTELLGGDQWAADMVVAWLPIVFTLLLAIVVYYTSIVLTRDARVGVASVLVLALAPLHINYTGLGALHHRPHQFLWFGVIILTVILLTTDMKNLAREQETHAAVRAHLGKRRTWYLAVSFGLALALYIHSWGGSTELFIPLLMYVGLRTALDLREDISPGLANLPLLVGMSVGTVVILLLHIGIGWHGPLVEGVTLMAFGSAIGLVGLGELWHRRGLSPWKYLLLQPLIVVSGVTLVFLARPGLLRTAMDSFGTIFTVISHPGSTQSTSLFATDLFVIGTPVAQIGITFFISLFVFVWCLQLVRNQYEPGWLLLAVFYIYYLAAAGIMIRFGGRLVIVLSILAGVGIVYILAVLGLARNPLKSPGFIDKSRPNSDGKKHRAVRVKVDPRQFSYVIAVMVVILGFNLLFIPTLAGQTTYDSSQLAVSEAVTSHAEQTDRVHPETYIFAPWDDVRMYNYFASGESEDERFARSNYGSFVTDSDPDRWSNVLDGQAGYVVVTDRDAHLPEETTHSQLYTNLSAERNSLPPLDNYQLIYMSEDRDVMLFALVPGAEIELAETNQQSVAIEAEVEVAGETFRYERPISTEESVTVPYPGTYSIDGSTVVVSQDDVEQGNVVTP